MAGDALTNFINSPPGVFVAGGVLYGIVWRCFAGVESLLKPDAKLSIALWILERKPLSPSWPGTFAAMFDRVFGEKHLSEKCFYRSAIVSYIARLLVGAYVDANWKFTWLWDYHGIWDLIVWGFFGNVIPDYISLLETRFVLSLVQRTRSTTLKLLGVILDFVLTSTISLIAAHIVLTIVWELPWRWTPSAILTHPLDSHQNHRWLVIMIPAFLTSIWLWLYVGAGLLLKASYRLNIGSNWFNRHFDIETQPLRCIGLLAGGIAAFAYWAVVIMVRVIG
jgi:hypothetical protein